MTLPDDAAPRKHRRRWLWFPWTLFVVLILGWTAGWFWLSAQAAQRMDAQARDLRAAGYRIEWSERHVEGFPFRITVRLAGARIAEPSGWGVEAPLLSGEAPVYALDHWLLSAPGGATLLRPAGGPLLIEGDVLRASLSDVGRLPPRLSFEGVNLTFRQPPGARPFPLKSARRLEIHTRAGPNDQGEVLVRATQADMELPGLLSRIAEDRPVDFEWDMVLSKISAFDGPAWPAAARGWSAAGGTITVKPSSLTAGKARLTASSGALKVGPDGRVVGALDLNLGEGSQALSAMTGGLPAPVFARANLVFKDGQTLLGPLAVAPAPRVF